MSNDLSHVTAPSSASAPTASLLTVVRDQRKTLLVAAVLAVAALWVLGALGEWRLAVALAIGVALGLLNHLVTEYWLLRIITSGIEPSRGAMVRSTILRLALLTLVAVGIAVALWPDGVGVLLGLAIFRLIALTMTSIPLLRELKGDLEGVNPR
jgi:O-antigen/teichoic acid export membrane protein